MNLTRDVAKLLLSSTVLIGLTHGSAQAQVTAAVDGTGTQVDIQVNPTGNIFNITGGTVAGGNLFHSFQQFGLNQTQTANFVDPGVQNILGRVTGGNASVINGIIQVTGGGANLYLMNPAGIIFGAGASLNVPGSFTATTANGIGFDNNQWFSATGSNDYPNLVGTPDKLAFTMSQPGAIVINTSNLSAPQGVTVAGGTVVSTVPLTNQGGIVIAAAPGTRLLRLSQAGNPLSLEIPTSTSTLPNTWTVPILSLPQLLTGGNAGNASGLTVDAAGVVTITGSGLAINNGDVIINGSINLSPVSSTDALSSLTVLADQTIDVKDIETLGGNVSIRSISGNIKAGNINTFTDRFSSEPLPPEATGLINLQTGAGRITVATLRSGYGGITIDAFDRFQAIETFPLSIALDGVRFSELRPSYQEIVAELAASKGISRAALENNTDDFFSIQAANLPASIIAVPGGETNQLVPTISIRHGGQSITESVNPGEIAITGRGSAYTFVVGPGEIEGQRQTWTAQEDFTLDAVNDQNFQQFFFPLSTAYRALILAEELPNTVSGTRGAIIIANDQTNQNLFSSLLSRNFLPKVCTSCPPPPPPPPPQCLSCDPPSKDINNLLINPGGDPFVDRLAALRQQLQGEDGQVAQRQLVAQSKESACGSAAIAAVPSGSREGGTGDAPDRATADAATSAQAGCNSSSDDSQILQLLEDAPGSSQSKQLELDSLPQRAEADHHSAPTR